MKTLLNKFTNSLKKNIHTSLIFFKKGKKSFQEKFNKVKIFNFSKEKTSAKKKIHSFGVRLKSFFTLLSIYNKKFITFFLTYGKKTLNIVILCVKKIITLLSPFMQKLFAFLGLCLEKLVHILFICIEKSIKILSPYTRRLANALRPAFEPSYKALIKMKTIFLPKFLVFRDKHLPFLKFPEKKCSAQKTKVSDFKSLVQRIKENIHDFKIFIENQIQRFNTYLNELEFSNSFQVLIWINASIACSLFILGVFFYSYNSWIFWAGYAAILSFWNFFLLSISIQKSLHINKLKIKTPRVPMFKQVIMSNLRLFITVFLLYTPLVRYDASPFALITGISLSVILIPFLLLNMRK